MIYMKHKATGSIVRVPDYQKSLMESRGFVVVEDPLPEKSKETKPDLNKDFVR